MKETITNGFNGQAVEFDKGIQKLVPRLIKFVYFSYSYNLDS